MKINHFVILKYLYLKKMLTNKKHWKNIKYKGFYFGFVQIVAKCKYCCKNMDF